MRIFLRTEWDEIILTSWEQIRRRGRGEDDHYRVLLSDGTVAEWIGPEGKA